MFPLWFVLAVGLSLAAFSSQGCGPTRYLVDLHDCEDVQDVQGMQIGKCAEVKVKK